MVLATVPEAPPTRRNQRATSCPAPISANEPKVDVSRFRVSGFSFSAGPEIKRTIAPKALERFKHRVREITRRAKGVSLETTVAELASYMRGWRSYFGFCE